jgi:hypothetical protein
VKFSAVVIISTVPSSVGGPYGAGVAEPVNWLSTAGGLGFISRQGQRVFPFTSKSKLVLEPTEPRVQWKDIGL